MLCYFCPIYFCILFSFLCQLKLSFFKSLFGSSLHLPPPLPVPSIFLIFSVIFNCSLFYLSPLIVQLPLSVDGIFSFLKVYSVAVYVFFLLLPFHLYFYFQWYFNCSLFYLSPLIVELPLSVDGIFAFLKVHSVAVYVFFLLLPFHLYFLFPVIF
jgi:hypothetical protein